MPEEMQQRGSTHSSTAIGGSSFDHEKPGSYGPLSIPPWVFANEDLATQASAQQDEIVARYNSPQYRPPPPIHFRPGRKWDHQRTAEPALPSAPFSEQHKRWEPLMKSGPNPSEIQPDGSHIVGQAWLDEHMPYLSAAGWEDDGQEQLPFGVRMGRGLMYRGKWLISPERQEKTVRFLWRLLLKNPYVPLLFRLTILAFSAAALGVSAGIFVRVDRSNRDPDSENQCATRASTYMAICVHAIAIPYVAYVTWDEYLSKPLGLRGVGAKISLLLCDLFFIVFSAANLSLAFDALTDHRWACFDEQYTLIGHENRFIPSSCPNNPDICTKQVSLSAVLMIGTCAWVITFSLSVLRVVEKLRPD